MLLKSLLLISLLGSVQLALAHKPASDVGTAACHEQSGQGCHIASVVNQRAQPLQRLWGERKFEDIDKVLRDWCLSDGRLANGDSELGAFETAFDRLFRASQSWESERTALVHWQQLAPDSLAAGLVEAIYWRAYAAQLRLGGAASMPRDALALYKEHLGRASARLQQVKAQGSTCPLWFSLNISMLLEGGVTRDAAARAYMDAVLAFPQAPLIHLAMAPAYSPRNGGSAVQFDQFARRAMFFTRSAEGAGMYARLYWTEDGKGRAPILFQDQHGLPEWRLVKGGFEDLLQRYPHDTWNRNKYASFACRANDRATYARLRQELGERIYPELWPHAWSVQVCDRKLGKKGLTG
jgi:hypothetical protein